MRRLAEPSDVRAPELTRARMADWATISSMATAGGTLVLAVATFSSVRSANHSARVAELSLLAGLRPVLITSREEDGEEHIGFGDGVRVTVAGHGGAVELVDGNLYMALALRNGGAGLAVLHGWRAFVAPFRDPLSTERPELDDFRRQSRDLYIPAGDRGFWQGAIRDPGDPMIERARAALADRERIAVDLLYGDQEGGQRTIARFGLSPWQDDDANKTGRRAEVTRYWNIDRSDPR